MKRYINHKRLKEDFMKKDLEKVILLTNKILSKRIGKQIFASSIAPDFEKAGEGKLAGITCTVGNNKIMRYNWKLSGGSGAIDSIDVWDGLTNLNPDLTIDVKGFNIVKIIDLIGNTLMNPKVGSQEFEEKTMPVNQGKLSGEISGSINAWLSEMVSDERGNIDTDKLKNTRITQLYKDYLFWYSEVNTDPSLNLVKDSSFRNYLLKAMEREGIENKFVRTINVRKASGENKKVSGAESKSFDDALLSMSLTDMKDFAETAVRMVLRGYENGQILAGEGGMGKTELVKRVLKDEGIKAKWITGGLKNTEALFNVLKRNNKKDQIVIFDDTDAVFEKKNLDIMKAALAPGNDRAITWYKK